jgi:prophage DNA circulation protein
MATTTSTYQQASDILSDAISTLSDAFKAANTADDKDTIFAVMEVLQDELNEITSEGLAASTSKYKVLTDAFKGYKAKLSKVQNEIDKIVKFVKLASDTISALAKVATLLA